MIMKEISLFIIVLLMVAICGCDQTPAKVETEVPGVLNNVSDQIANTTVPPQVDQMFRPLETSSDYVPPSTPIPTVASVPTSRDPIVGNWRYIGTGYDCAAAFSPDYRASATCSAGPVPIAKRSFVWAPAASSYGWMKNYTLMDTSDNSNYSIAYSGYTGELTSSVLPGSGYLIRVD